MSSNSFFRPLAVIIVVLTALGFLISCSNSAPQTPGAEQPAVADDEPITESTMPASDEPDPNTVLPTATPDIIPLTLSEPVVHQNNTEVVYVFYVENPNQDFGVEFVKYSTALLDAEGKEIRAESDQFLPALLPGQKIGVVGRSYIQEGTAAKAQITLVDSGISVALSELQPVIDQPFIVEDVKISPSSFDPSFPDVTGNFHNPLDIDLVSPSVYMIAYDSAGQIVGGGEAYVGFVLRNDNSPFHQSILLAGEVDRIETYPVVTTFRNLLTSTTTPEGTSPPSMLNSGYERDKFGNLDPVIILANPNSKHSVWENFMMAAYAPDGSLLEVVWDQINLSPNATVGLSRSMFLPPEAEIERIDFKIHAVSYEEADARPEFPYTVSKIESSGFGQVVTGEISNPTANELTRLIVHAIAYDEAGKIIGARRILIDSLPANGKADLECEFATDSIPAKVEFYPELGF